jgi:type IV secretory pathway protease TraF
MNNRNFWKIEIALCLVAIGALLGLTFGVGGLRINLTTSLPRGIYRLVDAPPQRGDLATFLSGARQPLLRPGP